jgi:hypothetical protein
MELRQGIATGTQLTVRYLADGRLEVKGAVSVATYQPSEFSYNAEREELYVPLSQGQKVLRQPFRR